MAGCVRRDNAVLLRELEGFRRRLDPLLAPGVVVPAAGPAPDAPDPAVSVPDPLFPPLEGGPR
jgi:hypothetical protein